MKRTRFLILAGLAIAAMSLPSFTHLAAQGPDPTQWPRVEEQDLQYLGAFRLPANATNGDSFSAGIAILAYNAAHDSLFASSYASRVAEVTIPTPVINSDINALPFATYLQGFTDPTEAT